ncbi:MAG: hypothetical protein Q8T09_21135 [Candidatus Melainabacteria bacterium]|nr:hypothetical protein [Candidatus Melainabacteria bacterium]
MTSSQEEVNEQISTWFKRAELAYHQKNTDLSRMCLHRRWQYQNELATIEGTAPPEESKEPNFYFGRDDPGDPDQPALVPRQPHPNSGAGEVAMPLPMEDSDNEA